MDAEKLKALREKYGMARASDVFDPEFRKVVDLLFREGDKRKQPYADPPTLLDAPARTDAAVQNFAGLDVALIGVPMDLGVTNRPGARFGPRAVRNVERIGPYHHVHKLVPMAACGGWRKLGSQSASSINSMPTRRQPVGSFRSATVGNS